MASHFNNKDIIIYTMRKFQLSIISLALASPAVLARTYTLAWDPVPDSRVDHYELSWGKSSGQYTSSKNTTDVSTTVDTLVPGYTWYLAVRACTKDSTTCSKFSNEVEIRTEIPVPSGLKLIR